MRKLILLFVCASGIIGAAAHQFSMEEVNNQLNRMYARVRSAQNARTLIEVQDQFNAYVNNPDLKQFIDEHVSLIPFLARIRALIASRLDQFGPLQIPAANRSRSDASSDDEIFEEVD